MNEKLKWKYTSASRENVFQGYETDLALIDELDQLNKTLQVIASNQERTQRISISPEKK
ncbi:hypothetical protein GQR93_09880 [Lentilactobacillus hilgardii]|uniref:Uncharacterized protein n=1 Tax=Lentilactobacillus hilgardii TaxID=1588 RepID=A0A6P1EB90_LENHI|nr:hypothetical protein [Lentilactobacillus hilgardii]QHB52481.1 hypothetical protein GQR93_09880 [Lentilactobacillus hilgardii]